MPFAANCPEESCPPADADPVNGDVIRFVRNDPPTAKDMETYADQGKPGSDACSACALSVLCRIEDVQAARKAMPWFKKQRVARATLSATYGRIKQTGPQKHHYSFWVEAAHGPSIHTKFTVVAT